MTIREWLARLFCRHDWQFVSRPYDAAQLEYYDKLYRCRKCGREELRPGTFPRPTAP